MYFESTLFESFRSFSRPSPLFFQSGRVGEGKLIKPGERKIDERLAEEVAPITNR